MSEALKKRLLDPSFKYVPAAETNLTVLFNRIRAQQQKQPRMHTVKEKSRA